MIKNNTQCLLVYEQFSVFFLTVYKIKMAPSLLIKTTLLSYSHVIIMSLVFVDLIIYLLYD